MYTLDIETRTRSEFIDVTSRLQDLVTKAGFSSGAVMLFVPHTTAGCTINENADPDVVRDMLTYFNRTIPKEGDYRHGEGNSDSHIKTSLFGSSVMVIVDGGRLQLGTWQGVYFCEFDGPRRRKMWVQLLAAQHA